MVRSRRTLLSRLSALHSVWDYLRERIRIDTRSLAVFRIGAGLLIIADVLLWSRNLVHFYSDDGVVPREMAREASADYAVSIYFLVGDPALVAVLFALQFLFALVLIVGYRTRVMMVVCFLCVISLDHRNPFVLSYADTLFRLLLFWSIFLPLGERWSVDAVHREREPRDSIVSVASFFILFQMVFMYVANALHKTESEAWHTGEAAALVLGLDNITFLFGETARNVPTLLTYGGRIWFYMLLFGWLLLLLPGRLRIVFVAMFVSVHASFALTVRIGAFPYVAILGLVPFLQTIFWNDTRRVLHVVGVTPGLPEARLEALARRVPDIRFNRERLGSLRTHAYTATMVVIVISILLVAGVLATSAGTLAAGDSDEREEELVAVLGNTTGVEQIHTVAESLKIDQRGWNIFAPNPRTHDRYHVFPAQTEDGELLDVYNERELTFERPRKELHHEFDTYRERFYMGSIRDGEHEAIRSTLAEYYCTEWADEHGVELTHVNIYHVTEQVTIETLDDPDRRDKRVWNVSRHGCGDNEPETFFEPDI